MSLAIRKKASVSIASQPTIATTAQDRLPAHRHLLPREADADVFVPPDRTVKRFENSVLGHTGLDVVAVWRAVVGGRDRKGGTRAGRDLPVRPPKILRNGVAPSTCSPMWTSRHECGCSGTYGKSSIPVSYDTRVACAQPARR